MNKIIKGLGATLLMAALASCGGSSLTGGSTSTNGSGGGGSTGTKVGSSLVELGSGVGTKFANQTLAIQVTKLAAGGTTGVTATLVDANNSNALYTQSVTVTFTSVCVSAGTATITSSVTTSTGTASATYTAAGCTGSDTITATAAVGSSSLTATGALTVQSATLGSLPFVSATPSTIGLAGMGGITSSKVTFKLLDTNGNPVPNVTMNFSLDITIGGVTISPTSAVTASDGTAFTFVQAGTEHTTVHVTATATSNGVTKTGGSNGLTISTGIPTERNFSLVLTSHNVEGNSVFLGASTSTVTVALLDRFQNPVPDGTQVSFTTNGGGINPNCVTANGTGSCQVTWTAQLPVPDPTTNAHDVLDHAHLLAYTTGEESFTDGDGNGIFATSASSTTDDTFTPFAGNAAAIDGFLGASPTQDDIGDPYIDTNEDGSYEVGEFYAAPIANTPRRAPDGTWHGEACGGVGSNATSVSARDENGTIQTVQCGTSSIIIGKEDCIVMTSSDLVVLDPTVTNSATLPLANSSSPATISVGSATSSHTYYILDSNGDVPPKGAVITITENSVTGAAITFAGGSLTVTVPDIADACSLGKNGNIPSNGAAAPLKGYPVQVLVTPQTGTAGPGGSITISVKTPVSNVINNGITIAVGP